MFHPNSQVLIPAQPVYILVGILMEVALLASQAFCDKFKDVARAKRSICSACSILAIRYPHRYGLAMDLRAIRELAMQKCFSARRGGV